MSVRTCLLVACIATTAVGGCARPAIPDTAIARAPEPKGLLSLERIFEDPPLAGRPPFQARLSDDGTWAGWLRSNENDSELADLWVMRVPDGEPKRIAASKELADPQGAKKTEAERMIEERRHVRHKGITSWHWCGTSSGRILFGLSGHLYLADAAAGSVRKLTTEPAPRLDARCSHDGMTISFVRSGDLHAMDPVTGKERKLTEGATATLTHGLAEFVAQEEMNRHEGYFWSPDDKKIAWLQVDETDVKVRTRHKIQADGTEMVTQRYPAAGQNNARVSMFVLDLASGKSSPTTLPSEDGYVARVGWFPNGEVWLQWQTRDQRKLSVMAPGPGATRALVEDEDADWVELDDHMKTCRSGAFTFTSERTGSNQLYLHDRDGKTASKRGGTSDDPVLAVVNVDEGCERALVLRATNRSREQHLFEIDWKTGAERQLTSERGWHDVVSDAQGRWMIDLHSSLGQPVRARLMDREGKVVRQIDTDIPSQSASIRWPEPEWVQVTAQDGAVMNGILLPPMDRQQGRKYPVVIHTYGGPTGQVASDRWSRGWLFHTWLTQRGYGVFLLDNRGSGNRERAFTRAMHYRFGMVEYEDQVRGAEYLKGLSWVDPDRIGIWGWSYGGYLSALSVMKEGNPFRAAAAVAPVSDWALYDTHYTERYMGMPQQRSALYDKASLLSQAAHLRKPLLIVHGMADDNVLFEHSVRLIAALQDKSVPFELMVYPGGAHGLKGRGTQLHVYRTLAAFFERRLAAP